MRTFTELQRLQRNDRQRLRRLSNPEKYRKATRDCEHRRRLKKYGLTDQSYEMLWSSQNNCCAICFTSENKTSRRWHLDHCHTTNKVRGILCHHCNILLGNAKESKTILESAINYLELHKCQIATS